MGAVQDQFGQGGWGCRRCGKAEGQRPCSVVHGLLCEEAWNGVAGILGLTAREVEVVRGVLAGQSDKKIAGALHMTWNTLQKHMKDLHTKLGVHTRGELSRCVDGAFFAWRDGPPSSPEKDRKTPPVGVNENSVRSV